MATANEGQFKKGFVPWNKGKIGVQPSTRKGMKLVPLSEETKHKQSLAMLKEKHWNWQGGKPKCLDCGKQLINYGSKWCIEHGKVIGVKNGRWIADRSKIKISDRILNDPLRKQWTKSVYRRDSFKCRIANQDCNGRIEAHHILGWSSYPELRYEINNGITLCHAHHPLKRAEEKRLAPVFQELVSVSN